MSLIKSELRVVTKIVHSAITVFPVSKNKHIYQTNCVYAHCTALKTWKILFPKLSKTVHIRRLHLYQQKSLNNTKCNSILYNNSNKTTVNIYIKIYFLFRHQNRNGVTHIHKHMSVYCRDKYKRKKYIIKIMKFLGWIKTHKFVPVLFVGTCFY